VSCIATRSGTNADEIPHRRSADLRRGLDQTHLPTASLSEIPTSVPGKTSCWRNQLIITRFPGVDPATFSHNTLESKTLMRRHPGAAGRGLIFAIHGV
jgi:hypothetical protein